ncbi:FUSC family protein [Pseudoclavibacter sp. VKM Ac-2888]|uniref:FUSC family protein n=1 Tax=Pseudoclavibacter sp. VKM Ac-2888 TaxID=2783830 RepID=UPI00188A9C85|nr:FUSC family protein [Pseudoclavibacter sp. VKM Ac-2888]MBF4548832.1 FUSC family protein [Pseudoclavibacter sp. VKM Ac-2888]
MPFSRHELIPGWRDLVTMGPYRRDHWVALRVALAIGAPLVLLWATGSMQLAIFAVFGAFTSVYGRGLDVFARLRLQSIAAGALLVSVGVGALISLSPERGLLVLPIAAAWAFLMSLLGDRVRWAPPGPMFQIFALAAIAALAVDGAVLLRGLGVAVVTAVWSLLLGLVFGAVGELVDRGRAARAAGGGAGAPAQAPGPAFSGPAASGASATGAPASGASAVGSLSTGSIRSVRPARLSTGSIRSVRPARSTPLGRAWMFAVGTLVAGAIPLLIGIGHPYWAMVSAIAGLSAATGFHRVLRATHRLVGTVLGLGAAAVLMAFEPSGLVVVLLVIALQGGVELFIVRNYTLGLLFLTPLVLVMGRLAGDVSAGQLLLERGVETLIGVAVAVAIAVVLERLPASSKL